MIRKRPVFPPVVSNRPIPRLISDPIGHHFLHASAAFRVHRIFAPENVVEQIELNTDSSTSSEVTGSGISLASNRRKAQEAVLSSELLRLTAPDVGPPVHDTSGVEVADFTSADHTPDLRIFWRNRLTDGLVEEFVVQRSRHGH